MRGSQKASVLFGLVALSLLASTAWASSTAPTMKIGSVSGQAGETLKVPVYLGEEARQIAAVDLILKVSGPAPLPEFPQNQGLLLNQALDQPMSLMKDLGDGSVHIAAAGSTGIDGPVELLEFPISLPESAQAGAVYKLSLSGDVVDANANKVTMTFVDGSLSVTGATVPTGPSTAKIYAGKVSGKPGEQARIPVYVSADAKQLAAVDLVVKLTGSTPIPTYSKDPDLLVNSQLGQPVSVVKDLGGGKLHVVLAGTTGITGAAELFSVPVVISAAAKAGAVYTVVISGDAVDVAGKPITTSFDNGTLTVLKPPSGGTLTATVANVKGQAGQTVQVPLSISADAKAVAAADLTFTITGPSPLLSYPKDADVILNPAFDKPVEAVNDLGSGRLHVVVAGVKGIDGPTQLLSIPVIVPSRAKTGATYRISVTGDLVNADSAPIKSTFVVGSLTVIGSGTTTGEIVATLANTKAKPGATATVEISLNAAAKGVEGAVLDVTYDTRTPATAPALELSGNAKAGKMMAADAIAITSSGTNKVRVAIAQTTASNGPGVVATLPFTVPKSAKSGTTYSLSLSASLSIGGKDQAVKATGGTIEVQGGRKKGDLDNNGSVNVNDAIEMIKYVARNQQPPADVLALVDFNGDGALTLTDAIDLLKQLVGLKPRDPGTL